MKGRYSTKGCKSNPQSLGASKKTLSKLWDTPPSTNRRPPRATARRTGELFGLLVFGAAWLGSVAWAVRGYLLLTIPTIPTTYY